MRLCTQEGEDIFLDFLTIPEQLSILGKVSNVFSLLDFSTINFQKKVSESRADSWKAQTYPHPTDAQPTYWAVVRRVVWISRQ